MHSVSFSSSGDRVAWVGHDSSISVADAARGMSISVIRTDFLPFLACIWVSENRLVAAVRYVCRLVVEDCYQSFSTFLEVGSWMLSYAF